MDNSRVFNMRLPESLSSELDRSVLLSGTASKASVVIGALEKYIVETSAEDEALASTTIRLPEDLFKRTKQLSKRLHIPMNTVIIRAVAGYLK